MKNNKELFIGLSFFAIVFLFFIIKGYRSKKLLQKESRYTIGLVYEIKPTNARFSAKIRYCVDSVEYIGIIKRKTNEKSIVGKRFYVKYYPPNPNNCDIILEYCVGDSIKDAPSLGWKYLPEYLPYLKK